MTAHEIVTAGLYNAAVSLMDDELREEIHRDMVPCSDEEFLQAYMERHEEKFGQAFVV